MTVQGSKAFLLHLTMFCCPLPYYCLTPWADVSLYAHILVLTIIRSYVILPRDSFLRSQQQIYRITTTWISSVHYLKRSTKFYFTHRHTYAGKRNMENIVMIFATICPYANQFLYNCSHCCISTLLY